MTTGPCLHIEELEVAPPPGQPGVPFWDRQWIDPKLHDLLFRGQGVNTYLVVDAHLRQQIVGLFDLDALDVPVRCLFKGELEEDSAASAPHLVDLTLPGGHVPRFHRTFFSDHWDKGTGILLSSDAPMDVLWSHLRKFLRSTTAQGRDRFFRFWETNTTRDYFEAISLMPERCKDLFALKSGHWITAIVSHASITAETQHITPIRAQIEAASYSKGPFSLSPSEEDALLKGVLRSHSKQLADSISVDGDTADMPTKTKDRIVFETLLAAYASGERDVAKIKSEAMRALGSIGGVQIAASNDSLV